MSGTWPPPGQPPQHQPPHHQQAPGYGPPQLPPRPSHPHAEPRTYPLMLRTWTYAAWKPILGIFVMAVGGLIVFPILLLPVLVVGVALEGGSGPFLQRVSDAASLASVTPSSMLYINLALASLIVLAMLLVRFLHGLRPRWLASVQPGIRWKFLFACVGLSVVALAASLVTSALLPQDPQELSGSPAFPTGQLAVTAVVILLTTPLQAIGEEYAFRGYLMQAFGSLFGNPWVAVVITSLLFGLAHGTQNFPLFFDRFAFGMIAGATVILVGGLEAGIALHVLNNLVAFSFAIAYDQLQGSLTVSEASWWQLPVTIVQNGLYLVLVLLVARRMGVRRTTSPPVADVEPGGAPGGRHDPVAGHAGP